MTDLYMAFSTSGEAKKTLSSWDWGADPMALLVSFDPQIFRGYEKLKSRIRPRRMMLDSGAFTAWSRGALIDIKALVEESKKQQWHESVCLDVVDDPEKSLSNALLMKSMGSPAYPVYHIGDPLDLLREYCRLFPKVGLSCLFGEPKKQSYRFIDKCFACSYPHKFHSFGWVASDLLMSYPFHSADSSAWVRKPAGFGRWKAFDLARIELRGRGVMSVALEVKWYLKLERELKLKWLKEMKRLNTLASNSPSP